MEHDDRRSVNHSPARPVIVAAGAFAMLVLAARVGGSVGTWAVAAGIAALTALALYLDRRGLTRRSPSRHATLAPLLALAGAFVFAVAVPASVLHSDASGQSTPQLTVRDFLSAAVVDNDGLTACGYLAPRARLSFERHSPTSPTCETFFGGAGLTLGGLTVQSNHDLNTLSYRVVPDGSARIVTVSHGGQSVSFVVRPADIADLDEFAAPPTPWRIDSSVAMLGSTPAAASAPNRHV